VVDGFDPTVVTVTALSPNRLRLLAETPGVTTLSLTDEFDANYSVDVFVEGDIRELQAYLQRLFPGSALEAIKLRDSIVLRGWVTEPDAIPQVMAIAEQFAPTVHNQMRVAGENQVMMKVRVIEVQRSKLKQMGFNFITLGQQYFVSSNVGGLVPLDSVTLPFGGPPMVEAVGQALANPTMQFAITGNDNIFHGFIEALQREALAKILAEPILVTTSGRPANLLSGGEFPILVPQGLGTATIDWREFGVRMEAVPIVLGNGRLRLDIAPEVSERDFSNAVEVNGFTVPGLTTRRVNTQVEMRFGDTLIIGGLISSRRNGTTQKVPVLGELPLIGAAFRRVEYDDRETELVIVVTPHLVNPIPAGQYPGPGPGMNSADPTAHELYLDGMLEVDKIGPNVGLEGNYNVVAPSASPMLPPPSGPIPSAPSAPTTTDSSTVDSLPPAPANSTTRRTPAAGSSPGLIQPPRSGAQPSAQLLAPGGAR
jgi:pilus assembly protein CpaC